MKNILTFDEFVNENYSQINEFKQYFAIKFNPTLAKKYEDLVKKITDEIVNGLTKFKSIEVVDDLEKLFPKAKEWWNHNNPDPKYGNPYIETSFNEGIFVGHYKCDKAEFSGDYEETPFFYKVYSDGIKAFIKDGMENHVLSEWNSHLKSIAYKYKIEFALNETNDHTLSFIQGTNKVSIFNDLWWSDERGGEKIEDKHPELRYVVLSLGFTVHIAPEKEEISSFKSARK